MNQQHFLEFVELLEGVYRCPLQSLLTFEKAPINEGFGHFVSNEGLNYLIKKCSIVIFYIGVEFVADFLIIDFEFLLFRVITPITNPVL
jgi:hypothetical protein